MPVPQNLALPTRRYNLGVGIAGEALKYFKYWIAAALLLSFLGPLAVSFNADIEVSSWYYAANAAKWFTTFVAGGWVYAMVPNLIATGMTRREFSVVMGVFGLLWSVALGVLVIAGFLAERVYYGAMDWTHGIQLNDAVAVIGSWGETAAFASVYPLMYLVYFAAGTVIGAAAYRWEGIGWLILVPILPVVFSLDIAVYNTEPFGPAWAGFLGRFMDDWGRGLVLAVIAVVALVLAIAARRILIDIPLRTKKG